MLAYSKTSFHRSYGEYFFLNLPFAYSVVYLHIHFLGEYHFHVTGDEILKLTYDVLVTSDEIFHDVNDLLFIYCYGILYTLTVCNTWSKAIKLKPGLSK